MPQEKAPIGGLTNRIDFDPLPGTPIPVTLGSTFLLPEWSENVPQLLDVLLV